MLFGAIEAGGTKFVCGVGDADSGSRRTVRIETRDVEETLGEVLTFFRESIREQGPIAALGIGSFGPLQLDRRAPGYGRIVATPKPGWQDADLPARMHRALRVPVAIDTDVNAAAIAEATRGAGRGAHSIAYITVGTGVGVGLVLEGRPVHGLGHPEAGHLRLRRHPAHDGFAGVCPFHGDCLEGLASGPAIVAAWGSSFSQLPVDHPAWDVQSSYLGQLCAALILTVAPEHIVLGGGLMAHQRLLIGARREARELLGGYCSAWGAPDDFDRRLTAPGCLEPPGLVGGYLLASQVFSEDRQAAS